MGMLAVILVLAGAYVALGVLFAVPFCFRWIGRVDPLAAAAGFGLRLLLVPGSVVLWPLLLWKLLTGRSGEQA